MKRLLFLFTVILISHLQIQAFILGDYQYTVLSETRGTVEVVRYLGNSETAEIPSKITSNARMFTVTSIGDSTFFECSNLASVTIPNSVTSIGESAFSGCYSLASITIPNSVTSIGSWAFSGCYSLASITIPNSVTSIGFSIFNGCYMTKDKFVNNSSCSDTGNWGITLCEETDEGLLIKDNRAIRCRRGATSITIPNSVTSIGEGAFYDCCSLASVTIPNSVTSIGFGAFEDCSNLASITIPNSVTSIGFGAFEDCSNLASITIPNSVTSIGSWAFSGCYSLASITIPNSVTSIGQGAFYVCRSLASITIPNSVTSIGERAFGNCHSLTSITIPNSVTSIGEWAFGECRSLASITIPNSVTSIGYRAFYGCYLTKDKFVNNSTCSDERNWGITLCEETGEGLLIKDNTVVCCRRGATSITIPNSVTSIRSSAFWGCSNLVSITIPNSVTSIGGWAFRGCSNLAFITIPNSVTSIGEFAFEDCSNLASITIPDFVIEIGEGLFAGCDNLVSITVASDNPIYDSRNNCNAIIMKENNGLIAGCSKSFIPDTVFSIGECAFCSLKSLTSITIPSSVTVIEGYGFEACRNIEEIYLLSETPAVVTRIIEGRSNCFDNEVYENAILYVPNTNGAIALYKVADCWKQFMHIVAIDMSGIDTPVVAPVFSSPAYFNLQGQRLTSPQRGINIIGGKKVLR